MTVKIAELTEREIDLLSHPYREIMKVLKADGTDHITNADQYTPTFMTLLRSMEEVENEKKRRRERLREERKEEREAELERLAKRVKERK